MEIRKLVEQSNLKHVAIIMDGNRRWAKKRLLPTLAGHKKGVDALKKVVMASNDFGIKYLTVYAFSTENWNRAKEEVDYLMELLARTVEIELQELYDNNVKVNFIGNLEGLAPELQKVLAAASAKTKDNAGVILNIALNYGGRDEIVRAVQKIVKEDIEDITDDVISNHLYTKSMPDPDLLIRTSGEMRLSNFLLWQIAYSEIYLTDTLWPDFDGRALQEAVVDFSKRKRRWGK